MARKDLLKGLMGEAPPPDQARAAKTGSNAPEKPPAPATEAPARRARGAIGAVSQSIEALKARSLIEIDPFLIDAGGLRDRLETDDAEDDALKASISEYGQQVPILVRPHPEEDGRYQIVYGRRRVLALRELDLPVKALVRDLDDGALVMAQGQENTARRGLSFIEKANFAAQMRDASYARKAICDAVAVDKTVMSRMMSIVDRIGLDAIAAIGAAPGIGRDRWAELATTVEQLDVAQDEIVSVVRGLTGGETSDERFEAVFSAFDGQGSARPEKRAYTPRAELTPIPSLRSGREIAAFVEHPKKLVVTLPRGRDGFGEWLIDHLSELHRDWIEKDQGGEGTNEQE
ncbi:MAG: plasmid partitioning protein RepB [Pseudomonadota bacterium]